ncbi:MAG: M60 family metallopeptidase [Clostridium sp.]|nr:M60 family metallopeptidase [Clostridium sp.]
MKKNAILWMAGAALMCGGILPVSAQSSDVNPMIVLSAQKSTVSYVDTVFTLKVKANVDYTMEAPEADWLSVKEGKNGRYILSLDKNVAETARTAQIIFREKDGDLVRTYTVEQEREQSVANLPVGQALKIKSATVTSEMWGETREFSQSGQGISLSYDGNENTIWHSPYTGNTNEQYFPITITYTLSAPGRVDCIQYTARQSGGSNGNLQLVEVLYKAEGSEEFVSAGEYDFGGGSSLIKLNSSLDNAAQVRLVVKSGYNNYASCAEMAFIQKDLGVLADEEVFADDIYSMLKPGITQERINQMNNDFYKLLAQKMFDGEYTTDYRVASYKCYTDPLKLSELWNAPGKQYDRLAGVTGINISKGTHAVVVSGIPAGISVRLSIMAWYEGKDGNSFDGGNPQHFEYTLKNGVNTINYTFDYDGLAYICYYADDSSLYPDIKVHFVNAQVNGYLSPDKTNEEMYELCDKAVNTCMDVWGTKVHSIWTAQGLRDYCKASDGVSLGYRQYMNVLDSLIQWEHELLGFVKYNRVPDTRTMAYTNYTYYMFQGGWGVSFHHNTESRVLNCRTLMYNDDDAIWGLSHEWGHQHQMKPYFCWAGMSEITNNTNSYYNIMAMGYTRSDKIRDWAPGRKHFLENVNTNGFKVSGVNSSVRHLAYLHRNELRSEKLREFAATMADSTITAVYKDPLKAISYTEVPIGETLCSFIMLYNYFTYIKGLKDFALDWYEALRQTDDENGSQVEKQGEVDKYELIASAQNGNKNGKLAVLRQKYPNSCWVTEGYIPEGVSYQQNSVPSILNYIRKMSRLSGYNLFPYFETWGHLRQVAMYIGDYGNFFYVMTPEMYNEFKEDMDALVESGELKAMPAGMVEEISNTKDVFELQGRAPGSATVPPAIPN